MKKLTYSDYADYYANKCKFCKGAKRVQVNNVWTGCICQHSASLKFQFEQFEIDPPELKYKSWEDFDGFVSGSQVLDQHMLVNAKQKALQYCFGSKESSATKNRRNNLIVHNHLKDGQNVVITGDSGTGRSLIAALIIKEVAHANMIHGLSMTFKSIKSYDLSVAAQWDSGKPVDYEMLNDLAVVDFLVVDKVDRLPERGHHTNPPDHNVMNWFFGTRIKDNLPTIVICSSRFWSDIVSKQYEVIRAQWGDPFVSIMRDPQNVVIDIKKASKS